MNHDSDESKLVERVVAAAPPSWRLNRLGDGTQIELRSGGEDCTDGPEVLISVGQELLIFWPTLNWEGPHEPVPTINFWRTISDPHSLDDLALKNLLKKACRARRRQYKRCRFCGQLVPPEHRYSPDVCHTCASDHFGVVY